MDTQLLRGPRTQPVTTVREGRTVSFFLPWTLPALEARAGEVTVTGHCFRHDTSNRTFIITWDNPRKWQ